MDKAKQQSYRAGRLPAGAAFRSQVAAAMMVAGAAWGASVDGLTASAARVLRTAVHNALTRGVGARRAMEVDLAFHGPSHRLDPAEAAVTQAVTSWAKWAPSWPGTAGRLEDAWAAEWDRPRARWRGPLAAVQAAARRLGWTATGPFDWLLPDGAAVPFG